MKRQYDVPLWHKHLLTLDEACAVFGLSQHKIRELTDKAESKCLLWCGSKRLIKRELFGRYLDTLHVI